MRVVKEIPHPELKITIFNWNNRYLIKFEAGFLEQTYKIQEFDLSTEQDLDTIVNDDFIQEVYKIFQNMNQSFSQAIIKSEL
jgi:hypothetical protein